MPCRFPFVAFPSARRLAGGPLLTQPQSSWMSEASRTPIPRQPEKSRRSRDPTKAGSIFPFMVEYGTTRRNLMKYLFHFTVAIASLVTVQAQPAAPEPGSLLPGGDSKWQLAWSDEFDYPDAKLEEKWVSQNSASTHILSSRWRENAVVANGTLKLVNKKERRGGNDWTSGNVWTKEHFKYGYFECRYRYAAAEGTNNSFWIMTQGKQPTGKKSFEIDINEGHFPNEINTNIHNHSDVTLVSGRKTHPSSSKSFAFGVRPDVSIQLETPVKTRRIRLTSTHGSHFHLGEFRIYNFNPAGYPDPFSVSADEDKKGLVNFAKNAGIKVSGFYQNSDDTSQNLVDGKPATPWITQSGGTKSVEFALAKEQTIGCIQFVNGWKDNGKWKSMMDNYRIECFDGQKWKDLAKFDILDGQYNFARDFHTYGLEWDEKQLVFYFNGKEIRRESNDFCHQPAPVWLSLAIIGWGGNITDAIDGTFMEVDYVRIYQRK
jgi:beta-glucanase (GH16 family)